MEKMFQTTNQYFLIQDYKLQITEGMYAIFILFRFDALMDIAIFLLREASSNPSRPSQFSRLTSRQRLRPTMEHHHSIGKNGHL